MRNDLQDDVFSGTNHPEMVSAYRRSVDVTAQ